MDNPTTWLAVAERPEMQERGAKNRLAKHLRMDPSFLGRKLSKRQSLTIAEAEAVRAFLDGDEPSADTTRARLRLCGDGVCRGW